MSPSENAVPISRAHTRQLLDARRHFYSETCACHDEACRFLRERLETMVVAVKVATDHLGDPLMASFTRAQLYAELARREHVPSKRESKELRRVRARGRR